MGAKNRLVRLCRALTGKSQRRFSAGCDIHHVLYAKYEQEVDPVVPSPPHLQRITREAGLTISDGMEVLRFADTLRRKRLRAGRTSGEDAFSELAGKLQSLAYQVYQRLLRLPLPESLPRAEDRERDRALWLQLKDLSEDQQMAVVKLVAESQTWVILESACEESTVQASRDVERAAGLVRFAEAVKAQLRVPEGFGKRLQALLIGHSANLLRVRGQLRAARSKLEEAKQLWAAGSDLDNLLDPGRLLDLEASLFRAERRFADALANLEKAIAVGRRKERYLINKGFILEVMGEHEPAIEALLEAKPLVEQQGDSRLLYMTYFNLGVNYTHLGFYAAATALLGRVRELVIERGDKIELTRTQWLAGRIALGLGQREEALGLLEEARREFEARGMGYDVALALLEIAVPLLDDGRTAEVKALAKDLAKVFETKGVHREALAALKIFHKAVQRETATAELARRVLRFLFRARHDEGVKFAG